MSPRPLRPRRGRTIASAKKEEGAMAIDTRNRTARRDNLIWANLEDIGYGE